ncbi:unknown protein [Seminavis robusta]|uniref:Uncharacterized protein n=1 Tax=Seminavis robusta TaxID=568900 RepID=A0A9N8HZ06_9STRA|nr:unknown protein [Seminavis robusta]|eukprot:Sro3170_g344740.1 n/a (203) ;mRNA; r:1434-2042
MGSDEDGSTSDNENDRQKFLQILHEQNLRTAEGQLRRQRGQLETAEGQLRMQRGQLETTEGEIQIKQANVAYYEKMVDLQKGGFIPPVGSLQVPLGLNVSSFPTASSGDIPSHIGARKPDTKPSKAPPKLDSPDTASKKPATDESSQKSSQSARAKSPDIGSEESKKPAKERDQSSNMEAEQSAHGKHNRTEIEKPVPDLFI